MAAVAINVSASPSSDGAHEDYENILRYSTLTSHLPPVRETDHSSYSRIHTTSSTQQYSAPYGANARDETGQPHPFDRDHNPRHPPPQAPQHSYPQAPQPRTNAWEASSRWPFTDAGLESPASNPPARAADHHYSAGFSLAPPTPFQSRRDGPSESQGLPDFQHSADSAGMQPLVLIQKFVIRDVSRRLGTTITPLIDTLAAIPFFISFLLLTRRWPAVSDRIRGCDDSRFPLSRVIACMPSNPF